MSSFVFRANASLSTGAGHIMRCLTLAHFLSKEGNDISFVFDKETTTYVPVKIPDHYQQIIIDCVLEEEIKILSELFSGTCDWLIIDDYTIDKKYQSQCREWANKIMIIDDMPIRKYDCDLLLDQTYGRNKEEYKKLVGDSSCILVGTEYALLREEFANSRMLSLKKREKLKSIKNILISMGATDPEEITLLVLDAIYKSNLDCNVTVVLSSSSSSLCHVKELAMRMQQKVNILCDIDNMAEIMIESDLAFGASGTSSWERCALGLPSLIFVVAENQIKIANELNKFGAAKLLGNAGNVTVNKIINELKKYFNEPGELISMSKKAFEICDGNGVLRVSNMLLNYNE